MSYQQSYQTQEFSYEQQQTTYIQQSGQEPTYQVTQSSYHSQSSSGLTVTFHSASELKSVETFGKQDPYVRFTYDFSDSKSFQETFTHKNGGKNAEWNQTFQLSSSSAPDLFIEVMNKESAGSDELIGFAAIPLRQIPQGQPLSASFTIYDVKSQSAGEVLITFSTQSQQQSGNPQGRGQSYVHEGHLKRCKSLRNKAIASDVGAVAIGGALAVGAGLLGKKLYDDNKKEKEEQERMEQEKERMEQERKRLDQEKKEFEQQQQEQQKRQQEQQKREEEEQKREQEQEKCKQEKREQEQEKCKQEKHKKKQDKHKKKEHRRKKSCDSSGSSGSSDSSDSSDSDRKGACHRGKRQSGGCANDWDPVGTYAAGDRVKYHGREYVCLQGHTSNPTWMPGAAHSLWQPC